VGDSYKVKKEQQMRTKAEKFLIVDDEPDMCWALEHILEKNGFLTKRALSGSEALTLIEPEHFRLAFVDAKLPDIDGLELARQIRKIDPDIRIIIVSGYFYKDDVVIQKALEEGLICGFIGKPFFHEEILETVKTASSL
jgi:DNA-binding NtrC family response regulator